MSEGPLYIATSNVSFTNSGENQFTNAMTEHITTVPKQIELTVMDDHQNITFPPKEPPKLSKYHNQWRTIKRCDRMNLLFSVLLLLLPVSVIFRMCVFNYNDLHTFIQTAFGYHKFNDYHTIPHSHKILTDVSDLTEQCATVNLNSIQGWFNGNSFDPDTKTWNDLSPNRNNISSEYFKGDIKIGLFGNNEDLKYLYGSKDEQMFAPKTLKMDYSHYSFIYIARYWSNDQNRIFVDNNNRSDVKWIVGFDNGKNGVSKHGNRWIAQNVNGSEYDSYSWVIGIDQRNSFHSYGQFDGEYFSNAYKNETENDTNDVPQFIRWGINIDEYEFSDFAVAEMILLNSSLSESQSECVTNYLIDKYELSIDPTAFDDINSTEVDDIDISDYTIQECDSWHFALDYKPNLRAWFTADAFDGEKLYDLSGHNHHIYQRNTEVQQISEFKIGEQIYPSITHQKYVYYSTFEWIKLYKLFMNSSSGFNTGTQWFTLYFIMRYNGNDKEHIFQIDKSDNKSTDTFLDIDKDSYSKNWFIGKFQIHETDTNSTDWFFQNLNTGKFIAHQDDMQTPLVKLSLNTYEGSEFAVAEMIMLRKNDASKYADCIELYLANKYHIETHLINWYSNWSFTNIIIYFVIAFSVIFVLTWCKMKDYKGCCCLDGQECEAWHCTCLWINVIVMSGYFLAVLMAQICCCICCGCFTPASTYCICHFTQNVSQFMSCWIPHRANFFQLNVNILFIASWFLFTLRIYFIFFYDNMYLYETFIFQYAGNALLLTLMTYWVSSHTHISSCSVHKQISIILTLLILVYLLVWVLFIIDFDPTIYYYYSDSILYFLNAVLIVYQICVHPCFVWCSPAIYQSILFIFVFSFDVHESFGYVYVDLLFQCATLIAGLLILSDTKSGQHPGYSTRGIFVKELVLLWYTKLDDVKMDNHSFETDKIVFEDAAEQKIQKYRKESDESQMRELSTQKYLENVAIEKGLHELGMSVKEISEGVNIKNWPKPVCHQFDCLKSEICLNNYYCLTEDTYDCYKDNVAKLCKFYRYKSRAKPFYFIELLAMKLYICEPNLRKQLELAFIDKYNPHRKESFFLWAQYFDAMSARRFCCSVLKKETYYGIHSATHSQQLPLVCSISIISLYHYVSAFYPSNDWKIIPIKFSRDRVNAYNITWMLSDDTNDSKHDKSKHIGTDIVLIFDHSQYKIRSQYFDGCGRSKRVKSSLNLLSKWVNINQLKRHIILSLNWSSETNTEKVVRLMKEFAFLDTKKDGKLDSEEIMQFMLWKDQYRLQRSDALKKARNMIRNVDINGISSNEWVYSIYCGSLFIDRNHVETIFEELIVSEEKRKITKNDLLLRYTDLNENQIESFIDEIISNANGRIYWNEFEEAMRFCPLDCDIEDELMVWGFIKEIETILPKSCIIPNSLYQLCYYFVFGYYSCC